MQFKEGNSLWYRVMRLICFFVLRLYYRRSYFKNIGGIPSNAGIIFAPNHQSAFMDAIMVSVMLKKQNRFLVRADIFKSPRAKKILTSMNLLPIYRMRDGVDSMDRNEQIFKTSEEALLRKETMVLFPEGNQANKWKLRPLKKGYARIAFGALNNMKTPTDLYIVPVGINYYDFFGFRGELVVEYGEPIKINDYQKEFKENEPKAINDLKGDLSGKMSKLLFNIRDEQNYDDIKSVSHIITDPEKPLSEDFENRKLFFDSFQKEEKREELISLTKSIKDLLESKSVSAKDFKLSRMGKVNILLFPFLALFSILASIINFPLLTPLNSIIKNKIKDPLFKPSIRYVFCLFIYPVIILLLLLVITLIFSWGVSISVVSGLASVSYLGLLASDRLKYWKIRKEVKKKVGDFKSFESNVLSKIQEVRRLID